MDLMDFILIVKLTPTSQTFVWESIRKMYEFLCILPKKYAPFFKKVVKSGKNVMYDCMTQRLCVVWCMKNDKLVHLNLSISLEIYINKVQLLTQFPP